MKASTFYRIAAVLLLLFAVGHTVGFRQSDPQWGVDALLTSMRSIHFDVQGFTRTYLGLLCRVRTLCHRVSSTRVGYSLAARQPSGRDFGTGAGHCLGASHWLCRRRSFELEIFLRRPYCFLNGDYCVSDFGGLALVEI